MKRMRPQKDWRLRVSGARAKLKVFPTLSVGSTRRGSHDDCFQIRKPRLQMVSWFLLRVICAWEGLQVCKRKWKAGLCECGGVPSILSSLE